MARSMASDFTPSRPEKAEVAFAEFGSAYSAAPPSPAARARAQLNLAAAALTREDAEDWLRDILSALGLSTRDGVVFVRFGQDGSTVRVYVAPDGALHCQWCDAQPIDFHTSSVVDMMTHLHEHRLNGGVVPWWVGDRLREYERG